MNPLEIAKKNSLPNTGTKKRIPSQVIGLARSNLTESLDDIGFFFL